MAGRRTATISRHRAARQRGTLFTTRSGTPYLLFFATTVLVVDWDVAGSFPGEPGIVDVPLTAGPCQARVSDFAAASLNALAGTNVEAAIDAACQ